MIGDTNMRGLQLPPISDADLTRQALAADPDVVVTDTIPLEAFMRPIGTAVLPEWYMPAPMPGGPHLVGWRRGVVFSFIASLVVIEAFGLCSTYGQLV